MDPLILAGKATIDEENRKWPVITFYPKNMKCGFVNEDLSSVLLSEDGNTLQQIEYQVGEQLTGRTWHKKATDNWFWFDFKLKGNHSVYRLMVCRKNTTFRNEKVLRGQVYLTYHIDDLSS